jgi:hypothetical protein
MHPNLFHRPLGDLAAAVLNREASELAVHPHRKENAVYVTESVALRSFQREGAVFRRQYDAQVPPSKQGSASPRHCDSYQALQRTSGCTAKQTPKLSSYISTSFSAKEIQGEARRVSVKSSCV